MLRKRSPLFSALLMLILCASVLAGSTYAQFTDLRQTTPNVTTAGSVEASLHYWNNGNWTNAETAAIFNHNRWEPGYTDVKYVKIGNAGSMSFLPNMLKIRPLQVFGPLGTKQCILYRTALHCQGFMLY